MARGPLFETPCRIVREVVVGGQGFSRRTFAMEQGKTTGYEVFVGVLRLSLLLPSSAKLVHFSLHLRFFCLSHGSQLTFLVVSLVFLLFHIEEEEQRV